MTSDSYTITGGDFEHAGLASSKLKERLKKIGVEPRTVRRAMIAAYEAEMNVVIHAHKGSMQITLDTGQLDVDVTDEGPGIPDIEKAMEEGFSTAPLAARELGFGAGMGLPNIKKNSDRFEIRSAVGRGTCVSFTIYLEPQEAFEALRTSIAVAGESCRECFHCLRACPTGAVRVRGGKPVILKHLCVDCTACIEACETNALIMAGAGAIPEATEDTVLMLPAGFLVQFGMSVSPKLVLTALAMIGFRDVRVAEWWERALREAVMTYAQQEARSKPVISPTCPAVVNLIGLRFPSLIEQVAPFLSPIEAAWHELAGRRTVFVACCPGQCSALQSLGVTEIVSPQRMHQAVQSLAVTGTDEGAEAMRESAAGLPGELGGLRVHGIHHVMRVLEEVENGFLRDISVLELFACDEGCFGSPGMPENPFVARHRWMQSRGQFEGSAQAVRRGVPLSARPGLRLDANMAQAILKLSRMDELARGLPGKDCGMCGAPTCAALAEDIVMDKASRTDCVHVDMSEEKTT